MRKIGTYVLESLHGWGEHYAVYEQTKYRHYLIVDKVEDEHDPLEYFHNHYIMPDEEVYSCANPDCIDIEPTLMRAERNTRYTDRYLGEAKKIIQSSGVKSNDNRATIF